MSLVQFMSIYLLVCTHITLLVVNGVTREYPKILMLQIGVTTIALTLGACGVFG